MTILKTERLILREITIDDAPFILELLNDPGWIKNIGDRGVRTVEAAKTYIEEKIIGDYVAKGYGMYLVVTKADDAYNPIGQCGLLKRDWLDEIEIGFAFLEKYCGQGFGYEAAKATIEYGKQKLNINSFVAITDKENVPSQKLLNKLGLTFEKMIIFEDDNEEVMYFTQQKSI